MAVPGAGSYRSAAPYSPTHSAQSVASLTSGFHDPRTPTHGGTPPHSGGTPQSGYAEPPTWAQHGPTSAYAVQHLAWLTPWQDCSASCAMAAPESACLLYLGSETWVAFSLQTVTTFVLHPP